MNIQPNKKIGLASFFQEFKSDHIELYYEEYMLHPSFKNVSNDIKLHRNRLIYLTLFQILASILGMLYIVIRRSFLYIFINMITLILALCGIYGAIRIHSIALILHCLFTISITGGFFIYQIFDLLLVKDTSYGNAKRFNDNLILFIFSLPYVYDLFTGVYNYMFLKKLSIHHSNMNQDQELLEAELKDIKSQYTNDDINNHINSVDNKICVICMVNPRETVFDPCGHVLCCENCSKAVFRNSSFRSARCPICRKSINNYMKFIMS